MEHRKNSDSTNYFPRFLRYVTTELVAIIIIITFIFYYIFTNVLLANIYTSSKDSLSQVAYSSNFMVDSAKSLLAQISTDFDICSLRYSSYLDPLEASTVLYRLQTYSSTMPFVDSIYVYNSHTDTFYTTLNNEIQSSSTFYDKEIIDILKNPENVDISTPIPRKIPLSTSDNYNQYSNVFTFIYCDKDVNGKTDNAIIVNVSELWVRDVINSLDRKNGNNVFIVESTGKILSSMHTIKMTSDISKTGYFRHISNSKSHSGYFIDTINGEKSLVSFVAINGLDWKFIKTVPYNTITEDINKIRKNTIIVCLVILFIGAVLSYILSKRFYKPIDDIIVMLKSTMMEDKAKVCKLTKHNTLRALLLDENSCIMDKLQKNFQDNDIKLSLEKELVLVLLKIDNFSEFCLKYNYEDRSLFKQQIINIASNCFSTICEFEPVDMGSDHIVLLFNTCDSISKDFKKTMESLLKSIQTNIEKELKMTVSITVGPRGYDIKDVNFLYDETLNASFYRMFLGHGCILFSGAQKTDKEYIYPVQLEKKLTDALFLGKNEETKKLYKEIVNEQFINYLFSSFSSTLLRLSFSINSTIEAIEKSHNINVHYILNTFIERLNTLETIDDVNQYFFDLFDDISNKIKQKSSIKYSDLTNKVINIINEKYMDSCICLTTIADSVGLSPIYLGRSFKKNVSKSIADYINDIRMEKAEHLLLTTNDPINDIVEKVGFSNRSYFHTMFKKKYGVTPCEYRNNDKKMNLKE